MATRRNPRERIGRLTNISRERDGAWSVHVTRAGEHHQKYFSDAVYGGRTNSLTAAQRFRDTLLRRVEPDTRVRRRQPEDTINETGIVGVSCERYQVGGRVYERYVATWQDGDGRNVRRRFSVRRYGRRKGKALAASARAKGVDQARAVRRARQRDEAAQRLSKAKPMPPRVKDPLSRKEINTQVPQRS